MQRRASYPRVRQVGEPETPRKLLLRVEEYL